jgi:hypothetical protein
VGAAAAEVAGVAVRLNGKDVAGIAITYDDHTEAQLWALLNDHYLTFERDFAIPVKPDDANAATLEGKIVVHTFRRGDSRVSVEVKKLDLVKKETANGLGWYVSEADARRLANLAGVGENADDAAEIKRLVPEATAMSRADFEKLAKSSTTPRLDDIADKSLTLHVLALEATGDAEASRDFHLLGESVPSPAQLAEEIYRGKRLFGLSVPGGPVTAIHADRIQEVTCDVDGDRATGEIKFQTPMLYEGRVEYVATRSDGKWRIVELSIPSRRVHIVRGDAGKWVNK